MRSILLVLALCLMVSVTQAGWTFQENGEWNSFEKIANLALPTFKTNVSGGNQYVYSSYFSCLQNRAPYTFTYLAFSMPAGGCWGNSISLRDGSNASLRDFSCYDTGVDYGGSSINREEITIIGGTPRRYTNSILMATGAVIGQNPQYYLICDAYGGGADMNVDDIVIGDYTTTVEKRIVGMPSPGAYYIKRDMVNPAASGFYNYSTEALVSSNYMDTTFGRSTIESNASETLYLINVDTEVVYDTKTTGNYSAGTLQWNVKSKIIDNASAPYGFYQVRFGTYLSDVIAYIANGANIAWDSDEYSQNDIATITYLIDGDYWDTSTYAYYIKIVDVYGTELYNQQVTEAASTVTYQWSSDADQGVYYAEIIAVPNDGSGDILLQYAITELSAYFGYSGTVLEDESALPVVNATVSYSQGSTVSTDTTDGNGTYSVTGFITGLPVWANASGSGYQTQNYTFIPLYARTVDRNITLEKNAHTITDITLGGVARDGVLDDDTYTITKGYGRPISDAICYISNSTAGENWTKTTNLAGFYNGTNLQMIPYDIFCTKIGYANSQVYQKELVAS